MVVVELRAHTGPLERHLDRPVVPKPIGRRSIIREASVASSSAGSEYLEEDPTPSPPRTPRRPPSRTEKNFKCDHPDCGKAYTKPSRLAEHQRTHTGDRPYKCEDCGNTYLRASHLQAHSRTHRSAEDRSFACSRDGCDKQFWTATHLKRHEVNHDMPAPYECETCRESFHKARQLRDHNVIAHMPPGTKPYPCPHPGCSWSFAIHHQLKAHLKTHDPTRYTCSHPEHEDQMPSFPTWSSLQTHLHEAHPPMCPHEECHGRVFKDRDRLRDHLKVHAHRAEDTARDAFDTGSESVDLPSTLNRAESRRARKRRMSEASGRPQKLSRIIDREAGKDHVCSESGCKKAFKTAFALKTHLNATHLAKRPHVCPHDGCNKSFAYVSNLQRHLARHDSVNQPNAQPERSACLANLTGEAYLRRKYACPSHLLDGSDVEMVCVQRFERLYDLRRHLGAEHQVELEDDELLQLLERTNGS